MPYRTDITTHPETGAIVSTASIGNADSSKPLPAVTRPDTLAEGYPDHWQREAGTDDAALNALGAAQAEMARAFNGSLEIRKTRDPSTPQAAHLESLALQYQGAVDRVSKQATRAQEQAQKRLQSIESQFRESVGWRETHAAELRSVIRSMSDGERSEFIGAAIEGKDGDAGDALAAVLGAPAALSGLKPEQARAYRSRAMMKHRPDLLKLEKTIGQASAHVRKAFSDMLMATDVVTAKNLRDQYRKEAEAAKAARDRVGPAFG